MSKLSTPPFRWAPKSLLISIAALLLCVALVGAAVLLSGLPVRTISARLADPSIVEGATLVEGEPLAFLLSRLPTAKLVISAESMRKLLDSTVVLSDCSNPARECASPTWEEGRTQWGDVPATALCAQSYAAGSDGTSTVHAICVDEKTNALYYSEWSLGQR